MRPTRRDVLRWLAVGGVSATGLVACSRTGDGSTSTARGAAPGEVTGRSTVLVAGQGLAERSKRRLVVIELAGGNDGLSTVVPYGIGRYHDLRPELALGGDEVVDLDGTYGLHRALTPMTTRPLAVVAGIGSSAPDLSHFEMSRRWWQGDPAGLDNRSTGFLGRLCDQLDEGQPLTGVSIGWGPSPALAAEKATTLALPDPDALWWLTEDSERSTALRVSMEAMSAGASPGGADPTGTAQAGIRAVLDVADLVTSLPEADESESYPSSDLAMKLALAARLIAADAGVRVVHVPMDGDFDTHEGHADRHPALLEELGSAVAAFGDDLDRRGLADRTLVCTTSEFGRRVGESSGGLDHGAASVALLWGPLTAISSPSVITENPDLDGLDDEGNLVATVDFDRLYATLAESWFGVPASDVLPGQPAPLDGIW